MIQAYFDNDTRKTYLTTTDKDGIKHSISMDDLIDWMTKAGLLKDAQVLKSTSPTQEAEEGDNERS